MLAVRTKIGVPAGLGIGRLTRAGSAAARRSVRTTKRALWALRKAGYYFLPPVAYDALRALARHCGPRVLRRDVRAQFYARLDARRAAAAPPQPAAGGDSFVADPGAPPDPAAVAMADRYREIYWQPEETPAQVAAKAGRYRRLAADTRLDRARLCRELARLERLAGDPVKACLYAVRAMRLIGRDEYRDLGWVRPLLEVSGYAPEAEAADALYGVRPDRDEACEKVLRAARNRCRSAPALPADYAVFDDRRGGGPAPLATVVITVYNAADKLPRFLQALQYQTLNRAGRMEVIVLDSGSPADEYAAWKGTTFTHPVPTLFVRTAGRETIQTAWNRGIGLARAPYLALLGADEALVPDALAALAGVLDSDPATDWAQADCLVTEVDTHGALAADLIGYDRAGYAPHLPYLDSCYLGPVGAVYRKALHQKVGYFDGTFRAAGDTEFKLRMLPGAKVRHLPRTLGVFLNYPEERATSSPRGELEDLRAWYLPRSAAGLRLGYDHRPAEAVEDLMVRALGYRKTYCRHLSTDFDLAAAAARVLRARRPESPALGLAPGIGRALAAYRALDHLPGVAPDVSAKAVAAARRAAAEAGAEHRAAGHGPGPAGYAVFNDNRHEQHSYFW